MDDGSKCMKYMIFIVNMIFVLAGLALVAFGAALLCKLQMNLDLVHDLTPAMPWVIIVVGLAIFCVSFLGCCGAIQENCCMLISFAIVLSLFVILKASTGAIVLARPDLMKGFADDQLKEIFNDPSKITIKENIELLLKCQAPMSNSTSPSSNIAVSVAVSSTTSKVSDHTRCQKKLEQFIDERKQAIAYGAIGLALLEGMGVILVAMLTCSIRSSSQKYEI